MLDAPQIQNILKHRYPFLLIDRVLELEEGTRAKAVKCVSINEPFFAGHFPDMPVMPGVLILEAMAQVSAIVGGKGKDSVGLFTSVYNAKFLKAVLPGDQLIIETEVIQKVKNLIRFKATAKVRDVLVAKAELGLFILSKDEFNKKTLCRVI